MPKDLTLETMQRGTVKVNQALQHSYKELIRFYDKHAQKRDYWKEKNGYYHRLLASLIRFIIPKGSSVLEIGCGTGALLHSCAPKRGVGVDFSQEMVKLARRNFPELEFRVRFAENLNLDEKFDYVVISDTVGNFLDVQRVFEEIHSVCTPRTRIVITYYNFLWEWLLRGAAKLGLKMPLPPQSWLTLQDIHNLLHLSGFEVIKRTYKVLIPVYIPLISNFCNRVLVNLPIFWKLGMSQIVIAKPCGQLNQVDSSVSIVVPCKNEKGNIAAIFSRVEKLGTRTELIFVDGNSDDGTVDEIKRLARTRPDLEVSLITQQGKGKGNAVRLGFSAATGDILMILDADLTVLPEELPKFYSAIVTGKGEFINGCRLIYPMDDGAMRFLNTIGNKFFSRAFSYLLEQPFKDTLCGTKVLYREDYEKLAQNRSYFGEFDPFGDFDLIFGASKLNLKIVEVPVRYRSRTYGTTKISRFRHGLLLVRMCLFALRKIKFI